MEILTNGGVRQVNFQRLTACSLAYGTADGSEIQDSPLEVGR